MSDLLYACRRHLWDWCIITGHMTQTHDGLEYPMATNYVGYIRRRLETHAHAVRGNADTQREKGKPEPLVAWLDSVADRIAALAAELEQEEPTYQGLEPTAPPH